MILLQLLIFDRTISLMDEGHMLLLTDIIARGGQLYRDVTTYPLPGSYYLLAQVFEIFGPSIRIARWIVMFEFATFVFCVLWILGRLVSVRLAMVGLLLLIVYRIWAFPHWHIYNYSSTALLFGAGALALLMRFFEKERVAGLAASGLLAGGAALCKQDYGAAGLLALNLCLVAWQRTAPDSRERRALATRLAWLNGPPLVAAAGTAAAYASQGLLGELLRQTVWNHLVGLSTFEYSSLPSLASFWTQDPALRSPYGLSAYFPAIVFTVDWGRVSISDLYANTPIWDIAIKIFFYLPYAVAMIGGVRLIGLRGKLRDPDSRLGVSQEMALTVYAILLLLSLNKPKDWVHVAILYWPFLCLLVVYGAALARRRPRLARIVAIVVAPAFLLLLGYSLWLGWRLRTDHPSRVEGARAGIYASPDEARVINEVVSYIDAHSAPDEPIVVFPYYPMLSFLSNRRGPHPGSYLIWPVAEFENRDRLIIDAMEQSRTNVVIFHFTQWAQFPWFDEYAPELFSYLVENFAIDRIFTDPSWGYMMAGLRRDSSLPPGRELVGPELQGATVRVERPGRPPTILTGKGRERQAARQLWPFRPVLALRPQRDPGRSVLSVGLRVPGNARLQSAVGVHPRLWFHYPGSTVTFAIDAIVDGRRDSLFSTTLDPHRDASDRGWIELDLPLDAYAGRRIELEFSTRCEGWAGEKLEMGGFGAPRLVVGDSSAVSRAPAVGLPEERAASHRGFGFE